MLIEIQMQLFGGLSIVVVRGTVAQTSRTPQARVRFPEVASATYGPVRDAARRSPIFLQTYEWIEKFLER